MPLDNSDALKYIPQQAPCLPYPESVTKRSDISELLEVLLEAIDYGQESLRVT